MVFYIYVRFYPGGQSEPYDAHSDTYSRDTSTYDRSRETRERTDSRDHIRSQSRDHSFDIKLERVTETKPIVKLERRNSPNRNSFVATYTRDHKMSFILDGQKDNIGEIEMSNESSISVLLF